jgi:hypothetical protein
METKDILGALAAILGVIGFIPYCWSIYQRKTKPHVFSWIPWFITTAVAFVGQIVEHGGAGTWATGTSAFFSFVIMLVSFFLGEKNITRSDWISFILSLATIPLWIATKEPLYSVVLATLINQLACFPTLRKSWHKPDEENGSMYVLLTVRSALSLMALENLVIVTFLFPLFQLLSNTVIFVTIFGRRAALPPYKQSLKS